MCDSRVSVRRTITKSDGRLPLGEPKTRKSRRTINLTEAAVHALRQDLARQLEHMQSLGDLHQDEGSFSPAESGLQSTLPTCASGRSRFCSSGLSFRGSASTT
jgi:hypothetical protein